jgi:hypothetical protein
VPSGGSTESIAATTCTGRRAVCTMVTHASRRTEQPYSILSSTAVAAELAAAELKMVPPPSASVHSWARSSARAWISAATFHSRRSSTRLSGSILTTP